MSAYKGNVYWKEQCDFCENRMFCKYRNAVELLQARLLVVELETEGCYGTLSFWCDYYFEDKQKVRQMMKRDVNRDRTCHIEHPCYGDAPVINGQPRCSECKTEFAVGTFPHYCPNCGAKVVDE